MMITGDASLLFVKVVVLYDFSVSCVLMSTETTQRGSNLIHQGTDIVQKTDMNTVLFRLHWVPIYTAYSRVNSGPAH